MKHTFSHAWMPVSITLLFCAFSVMAQPVIEWNKFFAGDKQDWFEGVANTQDGGYLLMGYSNSPASGDKSEDNEPIFDNFGQPDLDIWIIKVNANGEKQWDKTYGFGDGMFVRGELARSVIATQDGGFLLTGEETQHSTPCPCFQDLGDHFALKLDKDGNVQWYKTYSVGWDYLATTVVTKDGGYLLAGYTNRDNGNSWDYLVIKIDENGNKLWDKVFGGAEYDELTNAWATEDGGFLLTGYSASDASFDKSEDSRGGNDYWVVKIDKNGNKVWDKTFGGDANDQSQAIIPVSGGDYLVVGSAESGASGDKSDETRGGWVIRINKNGNTVWDKVIGAENNRLLSALPALDGNYLLAGYIPYDDGRRKAWAVKINGDGEVLWDLPIGNRKSEGITDIITTPDGGYLLGGIKNVLAYINNRVQEFAGYWIVKIDDENNTTQLTHFTLLNTDTDQDIAPLQEGDVINLSEVGNIKLSIRANAAQKVDQVRFELQGAFIHLHTEANAPYALFGDNPKADYAGKLWKPGNYTLTATPYLNNQAGTPLTVSFQVIEGAAAAVSYFVLVNADTDQDIRIVRAGEDIDLSALGNPALSIRAVTKPVNVDRVKLELSGPVNHTQTENNWPYALFGDEPNGPRDYTGKQWQAGNYTIKATPYLNNLAGTPLTLSFTVTDQGNSARLAVEVYPVPTTGEITITHEGAAEGANLKLLNFTGNVLLERPLSRQPVEQLDLSSFRKGFYYLKVIQQQEVQVKRIVLE